MVAIYSILATFAAFAAPAFCQSTPAQVVSNLNALTSQAQNLQAPAQSITAINGPLLVVGQGPFIDIINGLKTISDNAVTYSQQLQGAATVPAGTEATNIYNAYRNFNDIYSELLRTLTGKAGLFYTVPFIGQPMAAVLRIDENAIDNLEFAILDIVPSRASDFTDRFEALDQTTETAIEAYQGL